MNLQFFEHGIRLKTNRKLSLKQKENQTKRGEVTKFSKKSQNRLSWVYANGKWLSMITLTYHLHFPADQGKTSKVHLNRVLKMISDDNINYLWVLEWQGRDFPHYHIWMNHKCENDLWKKYVRKWLDVTFKHNYTREAEEVHLHDRNFTNWKVSIHLNYASKYAEKQAQKWLPIGVEKYGRWWGCSRDCVLPNKDINLDDINDVFLWQFRRNCKRAFFAWSKREKKNKFDKSTHLGFYSILSIPRRELLERLYYVSLQEREDFINTGIIYGKDSKAH